MKIPTRYGVEVPIENHEHLKNVINSAHSKTFILSDKPCDSTHEAYVVFDKTDSGKHFFYMKKNGIYSPDPDIDPIKMTVDEYYAFENTLDHNGENAFEFIKKLHDEKVPVINIKLLDGEIVAVNRHIVELWAKTCTNILVSKYNFDEIAAAMQDYASTVVVMVMQAKHDDIEICADSLDNLILLITRDIDNAIDKLKWRLED